MNSVTYLRIRDLYHGEKHLIKSAFATRSYSTFMRQATSCSGTPHRWDETRRPPEPRINTGD
jgi:hypothetical protein